MHRFVHNLSESKSFEQASREAGISAGGVCAAKVLDQALESQEMSVDRMDYFSILTTVFGQVCLRPSTVNLFWASLSILIVNCKKFKMVLLQKCL